MSIRGCILALSAVVLLASAPVAVRAGECPIRVSAVDLEGKGTSDHVFRYRVVLSADSGDVAPAAGLEINVGSGHAPVHVFASHLLLKSGEAAYFDIVIFKRPAQDVSTVAVFATGTENSGIPCASRSVRVGESLTALAVRDIPTVIVTTDDTKSISPDASLAAVVSGRTDLSTTRTVGLLDYPEAAKDSSTTGQVIVGLRIRPPGEIQKVHILTSSGSKLLDDAALAQVARSTYSAPIFDGIQVAEDSRTIEEFSLGDEWPRPMSDVLDLYCPVALNQIMLVTGLFAGTAFWYDVDVSTVRTYIDSLTLAVGGAHSPHALVTWSPMLGEHALGQSKNIKLDNPSVGGALFWPGEALIGGVVQDATPPLRKAVKCKSYAVPARNDLGGDALVAVAQTDRPWLTVPILESVVSARFATIAWPKYIPSPDDPGTAVAFDVLVHVAQSGQPLIAVIDNASIAPKFAAAALDAAMDSIYVLPRTPDGAPLTQTFETTYVYQPAK